jgi:hypothetical protein
VLERGILDHGDAATHIGDLVVRRNLVALIVRQRGDHRLRFADIDEQNARIGHDPRWLPKIAGRISRARQESDCGREYDRTTEQTLHSGHLNAEVC